MKSNLGFKGPIVKVEKWKLSEAKRSLTNVVGNDQVKIYFFYFAKTSKISEVEPKKIYFQGSFTEYHIFIYVDLYIHIYVQVHTGQHKLTLRHV